MDLKVYYYLCKRYWGNRGGAVRALLDSVGVHDVLSKSQGSSNPHNVVKATFDALLQLRSPQQIAAEEELL